jgi:hypothetical protein
MFRIYKHSLFGTKNQEVRARPSSDLGNTNAPGSKIEAKIRFVEKKAETATYKRKNVRFRPNRKNTDGGNTPRHINYLKYNSVHSHIMKIVLSVLSIIINQSMICQMHAAEQPPVRVSARPCPHREHDSVNTERAEKTRNDQIVFGSFIPYAVPS